MQKNKVLVIGAGFGGLSAASYLAKTGFDVTILEKNSWVGGRARSFENDGFKFDMGPSWYWMPDIFEQFFNDFGKKTADLYELKRLSPSYRMRFEDEVIDLPVGKENIIKLFEKYEKGAGEKLNVFLKQTENIYRISLRSFINNSYSNIKHILNLHTISELLRILNNYNGFIPVERQIRKRFKNEKIKKILSFPIFFLGGTTDNIPSVYCMMNHVDMNGGTWYPIGGIGKVADAVGKIALGEGVKIITNTEIKNIVIKDKKVTAVVSKNGKIIGCDLVVVNADYHHAETLLTEKGFTTYPEKYWNSRNLAPSALLIYLAIDKIVPGLLHHTLFFHNDWEQHNIDLYKKPVWPEKPLYYVSAPSKSDDTVAPKGKELLTILVPLASGLKDTPAKRNKLINYVMQDMEKILNFPLRKYILFKNTYCLNDFTRDYHSFRGNAYGLAHTALQTAIFRPKYKSKKVSNLYYTGQYTIPGIGLPLVLISGKLVAQEITKRHEI